MRGLAAAALLLAGPAATAPARDRAPPAVLDVPPDGHVTLMLEGQQVTVFASPGMPSRFTLSRATAVALIGPEAADFEPEKRGFSLVSIGVGTGARIGPVRVRGKAQSIRSGVGASAREVDVSWHEADAYPYGDALAGPWALPNPAVRFHLREPTTAREVTASFPLASRYIWWLATTRREIDGHSIAFAFAPQFPRTVASAAAGAAIAHALGGHFAGPSERVAISHGVSRPARPMALARPLAFGPVAIDRLMVRVSDYGDASGIADPAEADASETGDVVVKGRRRSRPLYVVYLGADLIGRCSSILYDKRAERIDLTCPPPH